MRAPMAWSGNCSSGQRKVTAPSPSSRQTDLSVGTTNTKSLISGKRLGRRAGDLWLLRDVDIEVSAGERVAIVGPSGSGKTLLLRCLALLDPLDEGQVAWHGQPVRGRDLPRFRGRVIYLHQQPAILAGTVEEDLRVPFELKTHSTQQFQRERITSWLKDLGRDEQFLAKQGSELSGGEAQITALMRALQLDPDVLLLDEPTSSLDSDAAGAVELLVHDWRLESPAERATVWVTHDEQQTGRVADRTIRVEKGQVTHGN